jgi:hypothetical protein
MRGPHERQPRATRPYGTSSADGEIDAVLRSEPPVDGASLSGWVALAEWTKPDGERMLVLLGKPEAGLLQMKSYLHSGLLNMVWSLYEPKQEGSESS